MLLELYLQGTAKIRGKSMAQTMSKRTTITLPDAVFDELEEWADQQGRPTANLASFLVEVGVRQAKEKGEFSPKPKKERKDK